MDIDQLCINTIRMLAVDMVQKANSGHPGMPMGAAPMAYALWTRFLKFDPANPELPDRDRFVLSAGHGSALLYSLLHLMGYDMPMEQLMNFRQWGSHTPGHPEYDPERGVECTTGPLGQGFGDGVGMAIAEKFLGAVFNRPGHEIVNQYTYAITSDGDLMEGISSEAASLAGHFKLGKLIYLYDNNHISLAGGTELTFTEDVAKRFEAFGWHVQKIEDGNDIASISGAIEVARAEARRPSLIIVRTHLAYGSPHKQDTFEAHGSPLGEEEVRLTKQNLGWPVEPPFHVPPEALERFRRSVPRGRKLSEEWDGKMEAYAKAHPDLKAKWDLMWDKNKKGAPGWKEKLPAFKESEPPVATRKAGGKVMNAIYDYVPSLIGGSGDLNPSTYTPLAERGTFEPPERGSEAVQGSVGKWGFGYPNIAYGVREHAMGAITSGLALHGGLLPFASTFLIFSDYMRPAIRLACLMRLHVIYVFTHDSVALGEDGPTHQPIEHLAGLRAMPNMTVIRPADANETSEAWAAAIERAGGPVSLIFSRQKLPVIDRRKYAPASGLHHGAYILAGKPSEKPDLIIIATGSEVHPALEAYETLAREGIKARVVSMPSMELFEEQPESYRNEVLPPGVMERITIEAAATSGWHKYAGPEGAIMGIDRFGASAPGGVNMKKFGLTAENILEKARALPGRKARA